MRVYEFPGERVQRVVIGRRRGIGPANLRPKLLNLTPELTLDLTDICDSCAKPIEAGAVLRGESTFCSIECSLEQAGFGSAG